MQPRQAIPEDKFKKIARVHNSSMGHCGHALTKRRLNDLSVTDRMITEFYPTKTTTAVETASCIFQYFGRFGTPEVVHTDRGTAFHNELVEELLLMSGTEQSLTTAYSSEENGIVERANQEVLRHLNAILFDSRVHDRWSFEQLPMVQRIMNTVEKTSTGVTPAQLILNNSISLFKANTHVTAGVAHTGHDKTHGSNRII